MNHAAVSRAVMDPNAQISSASMAMSAAISPCVATRPFPAVLTWLGNHLSASAVKDAADQGTDGEQLVVLEEAALEAEAHRQSLSGRPAGDGQHRDPGDRTRR